MTEYWISYDTAHSVKIGYLKISKMFSLLNTLWSYNSFEHVTINFEKRMYSFFFFLTYNACVKIHQTYIHLIRNSGQDFFLPMNVLLWMSSHVLVLCSTMYSSALYKTFLQSVLGKFKARNLNVLRVLSFISILAHSIISICIFNMRIE